MCYKSIVLLSFLPHAGRLDEIPLDVWLILVDGNT